MSDRERKFCKAELDIYKKETAHCEACEWCPPNIVSCTMLELHHIDKNNDPNNFILLCPNCHSIVHQLFGRKYAGPDRTALWLFLMEFVKLDNIFEQNELLTFVKKASTEEVVTRYFSLYAESV
jgi:hypothetical protein